MGIKIDESIQRYKNNAEYARTHGDLQGCLEFRQLAKWLEELRAYRNMYHADNVDNCLREKVVDNGMSIEIIDTTTSRPPSGELLERIAKEYGLMEMDIDQFAVTEDGHVVLLDDCGRCSYVDTEGFNLRIDFCEVADGKTD